VDATPLINAAPEFTQKKESLIEVVNLDFKMTLKRDSSNLRSRLVNVVCAWVEIKFITPFLFLDLHLSKSFKSCLPPIKVL